MTKLPFLTLWLFVLQLPPGPGTKRASTDAPTERQRGL